MYLVLDTEPFFGFEPLTLFQYIHNELMPTEMRNKTHLFNSFFYKALTQPMKKEVNKQKLPLSQRMHSQVRGCNTSDTLW